MFGYFNNDDLKWLENHHALKSNLGFYEIRYKDNNDFAIRFSKTDEYYYCELIYQYASIKMRQGKTLKEAIEKMITGCLLELEVHTKFLQFINSISQPK